MMEASKITCQCCLYEAPLYMFESVDNGLLKCKRCRNCFNDPLAFDKDTTYADCDSRKAVTRFSFSLNGADAIVFVRPGYIALAVGHDGRRKWLTAPKNHITDMPGGLQLYYVCMHPQLIWGTTGATSFGAFGTANLSLSGEYIAFHLAENDHIQNFENDLKTLVIKRMTAYVSRLVKRSSTALLKSSDGYANALGTLEEGVSLTKIDLRGYREGENAVVLPLHADPEDAPETEDFSTVNRQAVEMLRPPRKAYTIKKGVEEVFVRSAAKLERHKAGEKIDEDGLQGVDRILRFSAKEFEFPNGWGLTSQSCGVSGYYSAHGVISFYVDSTLLFGRMLMKTASWDQFIEQFFADVLKKKLSDALRQGLSMLVNRRDFDPERINEHLSSLSIAVANALNGEIDGEAPAFVAYGLRVKEMDILSIHFTSAWR